MEMRNTGVTCPLASAGGSPFVLSGFTEFLAIGRHAQPLAHNIEEIMRCTVKRACIGLWVARAPARELSLSASVFALKHRVSGGLFWCYRKNFIALNGFDESFLTVEDVDFAKRLKELGKMQRKRFKTLWRAAIWTSCRKWDKFGDWYLLKNLSFLRRILAGRDQEAADKFYYDFER